MFHSLVQNLEPLLQTYGALGVFLASIIEEVIAPIPSTLVVFSAAVLLTKGLTGAAAISTIAFKIMLPASVGMTIGSLFPYGLARMGERVAINKFGKTLGVNWELVEKAQKWAEKSKSDEALIFFSRAIPGFPSLAVSIIAGLARIPLYEFMLWSFLGALPRTFILGLLGWWGGKQYGAIMEFLSSIESSVLIIIVAVLVCIGIGWVIFQRRRIRKVK